MRNADAALVRPPVAIDLFSGAGGLAEGLLAAGLHVAAAVELHPQPALTHAFNHPGTRVLVGDIRQLDLGVLETALLDVVGDRRVDVVAGGPPCQGFSSAGRKSVDDPRNSLFRHYVRVVEHFRPRMFVLENVPGFKTMYGGAIYREALEAMHTLGYVTTDRILHARSMGVPQRRKRFVMVGWLPEECAPFTWPEAESSSRLSNPTLFGVDSSAHVSSSDALDDLADLMPGWEATRYSRKPGSEFAAARRAGNRLVFNHLATQHREKTADVIRRIKVGGSIRDIPAEERGTKKLTMSKLHPDLIANTVVSMPDDMLHYGQPRILSVRETARLQTFDDDYVFFGKRTSGFTDRRNDVPQYTQVGNAVPPLLAAALGRSLLTSLGAVHTDLRDLSRRRARHEWVLGTSGYSGYELAVDAASEIELKTVTGEGVELPISQTGVAVGKQPARALWATGQRGRVGQWAPGVIAKDRPSWHSDAPGVVGAA